MNGKGYGMNRWWLKLKPYLGIYLEGLEKITNILNHDSRYPVRNLNLTSPEYKSESLPTGPTCNLKITCNNELRRDISTG
jgi:hypothetical protein